MTDFVNDLETRNKKAKYMREWQKKNPHYNGWKQYNKKAAQLGEKTISYKKYLNLIENAPKDTLGRALIKPRGRKSEK